MTTRHGNLTNAPGVFNNRTARVSHYGSETLGKSQLSTYNDVFDNSDAPQRQSNQNIRKAKFKGYQNLALGTVSSENNESNPDFPSKSISFNYSGPTQFNKIPYKRSEQIQNITGGLAIPSLYLGLEENEELTGTADSTGKFTPNTNVDFKRTNSGEDYTNETSLLPTRANSGGGYGSDTTIGATDTSFRNANRGDLDIHTNKNVRATSSKKNPVISDGFSISHGDLGQYNDNNKRIYSIETPGID